MASSTSSRVPVLRPAAMQPATLAYVVRQALTHHDRRSINDELLQVEQGEREQLVSNVEDVLRRRRDDNDQDGPRCLALTRSRSDP